MHAVLFLLLVAAVIVVGTVYLGVRLVMALARGTGRLLFGPARQNPPVAQWESLRCRRPSCHGDNPVYASFCRRCGQPLSSRMRLSNVA